MNTWSYFLFIRHVRIVDFDNLQNHSYFKTSDKMIYLILQRKIIQRFNTFACITLNYFLHYLHFNFYFNTSYFGNKVFPKTNMKINSFCKYFLNSCTIIRFIIELYDKMNEFLIKNDKYSQDINKLK